MIPFWSNIVAFTASIGSLFKRRSPLGDPDKEQPGGTLGTGYPGELGSSAWNPFNRYSNPLALFYDLYEENTWVKSVCNKIAQEVVNDGWQLDDQSDEDKIHPKYNELNSWLEVSNFDEVRFWGALDLAICYNAFFYIQRNKLGQIIRFIRIPPQTMKPIGDAEKGVTHWRQRVGTRYIDFPVRDIWHIMGPNPQSDVIGLPILTCSVVDVEADNAMAQFNRSYFGNGTSAGTVFTWDQNDLRNTKTGEWTQRDESMAEKIWMHMTNYIEKRFQNPRSAHLPLVLRGNWKVQGAGQAKADAQFLNGRMFNARMVCTAYGFPMEALGLGEKGKLGGTLVDGSQSQLDSVVTWFANVIHKSFEKRIMQQELGWTKLNVIAKLRPNRITVEATLATKHLATTGCFTKNEIRRLTNHPTLPEGGDELHQAEGSGAAAGPYDQSETQPLGRSLENDVDYERLADLVVERLERAQRYREVS